MTFKSTSYLLNNPADLEIELDRLSLQAQAIFTLESKVFKKNLVKAPRSILDIGCGNASFLKLLSNYMPSANYIGIDRNTDLLLKAQIDNPNVKFDKFDFSESTKLNSLIKDNAIDQIICRFVFQHLSIEQQSKLLNTIKVGKQPSCRLTLADSDDDCLEFYPMNSAITELVRRKIEKQKIEGGNRKIGKSLGKLLNQFGYSKIREDRVLCSHDKLGWTNWESIAWPVITEGTRLSSDKEDKALLREGKSWFMQARKSKNYAASFSIFYASGI